MALIGDFARACAQLGDARFLGVFAKALGLTVLLLFAAAGVLVWLTGFIPTDLGTWWLIGRIELPTIGLTSLAIGAVIWASPFLMVPVAAIFVGFFLEEITDAVEDRHYADLPEARHIRLGEAIGAALRFLGVVVLVNLVALIPYLFFLIFSGPLAIGVFWAVNGYLLGREYFELVACRRLAPKELAAMRSRHFGTIWLAGVCMVAPLAIPIANLVVPVLGVATVTHMFHRLKG